MCRMLIVGNDQTGLLLDKIKIFTNLLGLSVETEYAPDYHNASSFLSCAYRVDVVMVDCTLIHEYRAMSDILNQRAPHVKWILLSDQTQVYSPTHCTLANPVDIKGFYFAISQLSPETVSRVPDELKNGRWCSNTDALLSRIMHALNIIHNDYMEDLSLNDLANRVYTSPCYFSTTFSRLLGISPMAYLNEYRMNKAEELLCSSDTSLQQICTMVGYRNLPYFCTCFKRKHRMTPTQFRQEYSMSAAT